MTESYDVLVVGAGPAGLQAAWKGALLHKRVALWTGPKAGSRIYWSPRVANLPGMSPLPGRKIIEQGFADIRAYEQDQGRSFVDVLEGVSATEVERLEDGYVLRGEGKDGPIETRGRILILATGAVDRQPKLKAFRKRDIEAILPYANKGLADYCLLCDGHTVTGKRVAVIGCDPGSRTVARSLKRNFGAETEVIAMCDEDQRPDGIDTEAGWTEAKSYLEHHKIPLHMGEVQGFDGLKGGTVRIQWADGREAAFDKVWISMGWYKVNNELAKQLGAQLDEGGFVRTTKEGRILLEGGDSLATAYVVGDLRADDWKQIPIAWGQAEAAVVDAFIFNL